MAWDARTQHPAQRTRVRRDGMRRRGRDATDRASVPCRAASRHVAVPKSGRRGSDRRRYGRNRRRRGRNWADSAESGRNLKKIKNKKKKKVQNAPYD